LLHHADSFDLMVFDVAITYEKMQHNKANKTVDQDMYSQEQLQEVMNKARGVKSDGNNSKK
jgi:hypothetical protein